MKGCWRKVKYDEAGLTLVEVLASIVLLSLIVTIFLATFGQSAKTSYVAEETLDATYIAQAEMENMYEQSRNTAYDQLASLLQTKGYTIILEENDRTIYEREVDQYLIKLALKAHKQAGMYHVIITVNDQDKGKAQMENVFTWRKEE